MMLDDNWGPSVLVLVPWLLALWLIRRASHSLASPGFLFAAAWGTAVAAPLLAAPEYPLWWPGVWLLFAFTATFSVFSILAERYASRGAPLRGTDPRETRMGLLRAVTLAGALSGTGAIYAAISSQGYGLADLTRLAAWIELGAQFALDRYTEGTTEPLWARLLSTGFYLGSLVGGVIWATSDRRGDRLVGLSAPLVGVAYASVLTTRAVFLFCGLFFFSAYLATRVQMGRAPTRLRASALLWLAVVPAAVLVLFIALQLSRGGLDDLSRVGEVVSHLKPWFFGHVAGFTCWLHDSFFADEPLRLGQRTFGGLFQLLGIQERILGLYVERVNVGGEHETNVFTFFRGLIEDFGPGALPVMVGLGLSSGAAYGAVRRGRAGAVAILALLYALALWSPIVSLANYNSLLLASGLFLVVLRWARIRVPQEPSPETAPRSA